jgi:hypothetical protein
MRSDKLCLLNSAVLLFDRADKEKPKGETAMRVHIGGQLSRNVPRLALAIVLVGISLAPVTHANPPNEIVLVVPTSLPTLARQSGEAMFLHDTMDGRTLLYVEQHEGAQVAIFDVTDPAHVTGKGSVQLDGAGPFDFVADLGKRGELVRFRGDKGDAVLDLSHIPVLMPVPGLDTRNSTVVLADDSSRLTGRAVNAAVGKATRDYQVFQSGESPSDDRVVEVKQVRQEVTNPDTGTTFLLAENGLYLVRRPALEAEPEAFR